MYFSLATGLGHFITSNWLLVVLSLIPVIYWYLTRNFDYWTKRGIKGPPPSLFIGSIFNLNTPIPLLYQMYMKKYGKYFGIVEGSKASLVICDPELIKRILVKDFYIFRNRAQLPTAHHIFGQNLAHARDEKWKRIRSILTPMFTKLKLRKMEDLMQNCVGALMQSFDSMAKSGRTFEVRDPMGKFTMDVISKCAFAADTNAHQEKDNVFLLNAKQVFSFSRARIMAFLLVPAFIQQWFLNMKWKPFYMSYFDFFENLTRHLISERRANHQHNDILQLLVNAEFSEESLHQAFKDDFSNQADGHHVNAGNEELEREENELKNIIGSKYLSEAEIMAQAMVFLLAGYETTASTLSFCLFELAINPRIQEKLYNEIQSTKKVDPKLSYTSLAQIDYLDAVISETLRKHSPVLVLNREANEDYYIPELKLTMAKNQEVRFPIHAIHHNEEYFPNPEAFEPERFLPENRHKIIPYTYIPFGGGPRNCIGMRFALTETKLGLANIVDRFQVIRVDETTDQLTLLPGINLLKTSPIYLGVKVRK